MQQSAGATGGAAGVSQAEHALAASRVWRERGNDEHKRQTNMDPQPGKGLCAASPPLHVHACRGPLLLVFYRLGAVQNLDRKDTNAAPETAQVVRLTPTARISPTSSPPGLQRNDVFWFLLFSD